MILTMLFLIVKYRYLASFFVLLLAFTACGSPKEEKTSKTDNLFESTEFSIVMPKYWVQRGDAPWSIISSQTKGEAMAVFQTKETYLKNTNFGYAKITVGHSNEQDAVEGCLHPMETNKIITQTKVNFNEVTFAKISLTDAGAGNRYATNSYRTLHNGKCWAVESVVNYSPIEFYGKDSEVTEFNLEKTEKNIQEIIHTFKFK